MTDSQAAPITGELPIFSQERRTEIESTFTTNIRRIGKYRIGLYCEPAAFPGVAGGLYQSRLRSLRSNNMTIIDRYLLFMFLRIFLVCVVSFSGLFVVIHLFSNLDELSALSKNGGWPKLMWEFYGPRVAEIFDKTAAVWVLVSAVFVVSLMERKHEITAIEAAGITKMRLLRAVFLCAGVIIAVGIVNREYLIPQVKDQLVRTAQNWDSQEKISMGVYYDLESQAKVRGKLLSLADRRIDQVEVQLPVEINGTEATQLRIQSRWATIESANEWHPAGLWLHLVADAGQGLPLTSLQMDGQTRVYCPLDTPWLKPGQCFVVCQFDPYTAAYGEKLKNYQSTQEMLTELRKPRRNNSAQIKAHSRLLHPLLEMSLLLLGLPLAIGRMDRNIFLSAGICFLIVGGLQLTVIISHNLGEYHVIQPPALAAWLPVIIFTPLAVVAVTRINR